MLIAMNAVSESRGWRRARRGQGEIDEVAELGAEDHGKAGGKAARDRLAAVSSTAGPGVAANRKHIAR